MNADTLRELSDNAYCDYIAQLRRPECLGYEQKLRDGCFSKANLDAHVRAGELLSRHRTLAEISDQFAAALVEARLEEARMRPHDNSCPMSLNASWECDCDTGNRIADLERQAASGKG